MNFNDMFFGSGPGSIKHRKMMQALPTEIAPQQRTFTPGPMPQVPFMPQVNIAPQTFGGPPPFMPPSESGRGIPMGMQDRLGPLFQQLTQQQQGQGQGSPMAALFQQLMQQQQGQGQQFGGFGNIPNIARHMNRGMAGPGPTPTVPRSAVNLGFRPSFYGG